jgi:hypothetical protein
MSQAYKYGNHQGHDYQGDYQARASRKDSKIMRAMKGVASFDLLDAVARDDARRRAEQNRQRNQQG